jgi:hypothetical protein
MAAPSIPGSYIGEHRDGYFWNGTSWDQGETETGTGAAGGATAEELFRRQATASTPAPSTAFGGTVINQQNATPAPASAPSASASAAKRASILATIMRTESGGKNIPQNIDDINMRRGDPAQGFYQITGGTWREHGGDATGHKSALDAPYVTQLQIAQNIPIERWGPATQEALKSAGYEPKPGETLGQMLARYNEDPTATRPEDVGGSSAGGTTAVAAAPAAPAAPYAPPAGLLAGSSDPAALLAAQQAAAKAKEEEAASSGLMKQGMGLLGQATTPGAPIQAAQAQVHRPQVQPTAMPDFLEILAQQRLKQRGIV